jgi:hypothetical protein
MGAADSSNGGKFVGKIIEGARDHQQGKVLQPDLWQPYQAW